MPWEDRSRRHWLTLARVVEQQIALHAFSAVHLHGFLPWALGTRMGRLLPRQTRVYYSPHGSRTLGLLRPLQTTVGALMSLAGVRQPEVIASSLSDAQRLKGLVAAAINDAGSLRMRSYRVALLVSEGADPAQVQQEAAQFNDTMARLRKGDPARPLFLPDNVEVRSQAAEIARYWQHEMLPKMAQVQLDPQRNTTRVDLGAFVNRIDKLVRLVEEDNARNTTLLRFFQMMLMAMA